MTNAMVLVTMGTDVALALIGVMWVWWYHSYLQNNIVTKNNNITAVPAVEYKHYSYELENTTDCI